MCVRACFWIGARQHDHKSLTTRPRKYNAIMFVWHKITHIYMYISITFGNRHWLRDLPDRHLHGHVLQYDHRLGGLLSVRVVQLRAAVDVVRQRVEHGELHTGAPADQSHECVQSGQGVLRVSVPECNTNNSDRFECGSGCLWFVSIYSDGRTGSDSNQILDRVDLYIIK